ncbi:MAG: hypothetical protein AAF570_12960, partial [Bacteroidota bacterium]
MALHKIRNHFDRFCNELGVTGDASVLQCAKDAQFSSLSAQLQGVLNAILQSEKAASSGVNTQGSSGSFNNSFGRDFSDTTSTPAPAPVPAPTNSISSADKQEMVLEWHYFMNFILDGKGHAATDGALNLNDGALTTDFPSKFSHLNATANFISTPGAGSQVQAYETSLLTTLTGNIPESEIIMGIVDWTIQRAKEELMRSFLKRWIETIEGDSILMTAFPRTLDLLATTDLSTIISDGDVWKAAFQQDLNAAPANLPSITRQVLARVRSERITPELRREIMGMAIVTSDLFLSLKRKNSLADAIGLASKEVSLRDSLSYTERGLLVAEILVSSVRLAPDGSATFISPQNILQLSPGQMRDYWNLIFVRNAQLFKKAFRIDNLKKFYNSVLEKINRFQLVLSKVANILTDVKTILTVQPNSTVNARSTAKNGITFQDVDDYFQLSMNLITEALSLVQEFDVPVPEVATKLKDVVLPLGTYVMDMAEGVATQQYGMVVTNMISALELLSNKVVKDPKVKATLQTAENLAKMVDHWNKDVKNQSTGEGLITAAHERLRSFLKAVEASISAEVRDLIQETLNKLKDAAISELNKAKAFVKAELKKLEKAVAEKVKALVDDPGLEELVTALNKYGRFVVNVLTAANSEEVKQAFEEAATGVGSFMVKQESKSSIFVTFLPGASIGREIAVAPAQIAAQGVDSVVASNKTFGGASLPLGIEFSMGVKSRVIGAVGLYAQFADLGQLLNYRLGKQDSVAAFPEIGFSQVL